MGPGDAWTVDQLAAGKLLAELGLDATAESVALVAAHFARHRHDLTSWAAERAHARMIETLESVSGDYFARESEQWSEGFRHAEMQVMAMSPQELLDLGPDRALSKGKILRKMVREARDG